jgi:hypothetical protein
MMAGTTPPLPRGTPDDFSRQFIDSSDYPTPVDPETKSPTVGGGISFVRKRWRQLLGGDKVRTNRDADRNPEATTLPNRVVIEQGKQKVAFDFDDTRREATITLSTEDKGKFTTTTNVRYSVKVTLGTEYADVKRMAAETADLPERKALVLKTLGSYDDTTYHAVTPDVMAKELRTLATAHDTRVPPRLS